MNWRDHFSDDFCSQIMDELREPGNCGVLSGFARSERVGALSDAIIDVIREAVGDLWATQLSDGVSVLRVVDILDSLGLSDRNLAFVRKLHDLLDSTRDNMVVDEGVLESLVLRAKRRRERDRAAQFEFQKTGDGWQIRFAGELTVIKHSVGSRYIAELLSRPYKKVFAPELHAAATGQVVVCNIGSAGEQADSQALEQIKQEYLDAGAELEKAVQNNDLAAQDRLRREIAPLEDYLKSVKGYGGRRRRASDDADKIRRSVTQAIRRVIKSLSCEDKLPAAARHLDNAIKTGLFMSYEPEVELAWSLVI
jgi:hypothetical protein